MTFYVHDAVYIQTLMWFRFLILVSVEILESDHSYKYTICTSCDCEPGASGDYVNQSQIDTTHTHTHTHLTGDQKTKAPPFTLG